MLNTTTGCCATLESRKSSWSPTRYLTKRHRTLGCFARRNFLTEKILIFSVPSDTWPEMTPRYCAVLYWTPWDSLWIFQFSHAQDLTERHCAELQATIGRRTLPNEIAKRIFLFLRSELHATGHYWRTRYFTTRWRLASRRELLSLLHSQPNTTTPELRWPNNTG